MIAPSAAPVLAALDAAAEQADEPTLNATLAVVPEEPKRQRRQAVHINVRYDERELDPLTQMKLHTLRREIHALNKSLRERNDTITRLRHEVRLRDRVMRLKEEARIDGRGQLLAEVTEAAASSRASATTKAAVERVVHAGKHRLVDVEPMAAIEDASLLGG